MKDTVAKQLVRWQRAQGNSCGDPEEKNRDHATFRLVPRPVGSQGAGKPRVGSKLTESAGPFEVVQLASLPAYVTKPRHKGRIMDCQPVREDSLQAFNVK